LEDVLVRDNRRGNQSQNQEAEDWLESDHGNPLCHKRNCCE
jgi:hypothetical protein